MHVLVYNTFSRATKSRPILLQGGLVASFGKDLFHMTPGTHGGAEVVGPGEALGMQQREVKLVESAFSAYNRHGAINVQAAMNMIASSAALLPRHFGTNPLKKVSRQLSNNCDCA